MKKMQCEVCGSTEIKKVEDGIFECQSCGVQYSKDDLQKLLVEITGKVKIDKSEEAENNLKRAKEFEEDGKLNQAKEYYDKTLDINADDEESKKGLERIREKQELSEFYIIDPNVDPEDNVREFLEQLSITNNIACDIYKEIAIKSVREIYYPFYFLKMTGKLVWNAISCRYYYENETVYKKRYDAKRKEYVTEPETQRVQKISRTPVNGIYNHSDDLLRIAGNAMEQSTEGGDAETRAQLIAEFEMQQCDKYADYSPKVLDLSKVVKEDGRALYNGIELNLETDSTILQNAKAELKNNVFETGAKLVQSNIPGDFWENYHHSGEITKSSVAKVCIPVQIIEYTYKGKTYVALSDLMSGTTTMPVIYPCDTELSNAKETLKEEKENSDSMPATFGFGVLGGIAVLIMLVAAMIFDIQSAGFLAVFIGLSILSVALLIIGAIFHARDKKNTSEHSVEIKKTMYLPRKEVLLKSKEIFFKEYTNYASAAKAASDADVITINEIHLAVSSAKDPSSFAEDVSSVEEFDSVAQTLNYGISKQKKVRLLSVIPMLISVFAVTVMWINISDTKMWFAWVPMILSYFALIVSGIILIITFIICVRSNSNVHEFKACLRSHEWVSTEPDDTPPDDMVNKEAIDACVQKIETMKNKKRRNLKWLFFVTPITIAVIAVGSVLAYFAEQNSIKAQIKPYYESINGNTYGCIVASEDTRYEGHYREMTFTSGNSLTYTDSYIDSHGEPYSSSDTRVYRICREVTTGDIYVIVGGSHYQVKDMVGDYGINYFQGVEKYNTDEYYLLD